VSEIKETGRFSAEALLRGTAFLNDKPYADFRLLRIDYLTSISLKVE
jgi:hypothetical protein